MSPGSTSRHQTTSGPTTSSQSVPAAITIGPNGHRDPRPDPLAERAAARGEEQHADGDRRAWRARPRARCSRRRSGAAGRGRRGSRRARRRRRSVIALAALKVRSAKRPSGTIGSRVAPLGDARTRPPRAPPMPAAHHVALPPASVSAQVIPASATEASAAPRTSKRLCARGSRVSGTQRWASQTVSAASGRLMRKIQRHEAWSTSRPPTSGPSAAAIPPRPDQAPIARLRSSARKAPWIIARLPGVSSAPPMPWSTRASDQHLGVGREPAEQRGQRRTRSCR